MKTICKGILSCFLALLMLFQVSESLVAFAVEETDKALNPTHHIEVTVPDSLNDGENYFFIREDTFAISEKSRDKLYIPIQRTGNTEGSSEVTLKLIDMSARFGVNYEAEIYNDPVPPATIMGGIAVIDLFLNADEQFETDPMSEEELGSVLMENGGGAQPLPGASGEPQ